MFNNILVIGAQTFIGFSLCEKLIIEGIEVQAILTMPKSNIAKKMLEERLMVVGRNAMLNINEGLCENEIEKPAFIIHCCDDGVEEEMIERDKKLLEQSINLAGKWGLSFVYISSKNRGDNGLKERHHIYCKQYIKNNCKSPTFIYLPILYGPFQPISEKIHQFLAQSNRNENLLLIDQPLLYITDAVDYIWNLIHEEKFGLDVTVYSKIFYEGGLPFPIQIGIEQEEKEFSEHLDSSVDLVDGLKAQLEHIKKFQEILSNSS